MKARSNVKLVLDAIMHEKIGPDADFNCLEDADLTSEQKANLTYEEVFAMNLIYNALKGDMKASGEVLDRLYGKAQQHIVQETKITYDTWLQDLAQDEPQVIDAEITDTRPQVGEKSLLVDGGSAYDDDILEDLGLL